MQVWCTVLARSSKDLQGPLLAAIIEDMQPFGPVGVVPEIDDYRLSWLMHCRTGKSNPACMKDLGT